MEKVNGGNSVGACPNCSSENLSQLPPNQFSRKPGYLCRNCGIKLRSRNSGWVYLGIIILGTTMAIGGVLVFFSDRPETGAPGRSPLNLLFMGIACAGWAGWQLRLPSVTRTPM